MKKLLINLLKLFGYKLVKINPKKITEIPVTRYQKPLFIEFIGISGVGKTTLFKAMVQQRTTDDNWLGINEYIKYLNDNLWSGIEDIDPAYNKILHKKYEQVISKNNTRHIINLITFFFSNMKEEIIAVYNNKEYTLIMEDGLFHNFGNNIKELYLKKEIDLSHLTKNRAFVYCYADPDVISKRILERHQTIKHIRPQHKNKTLTELIKAHETLIKNQNDFVELLQSLDTPFIKIDTSENLEENALKVREFIKNLQEGIKSVNKE
ncbi:MAG: hypothetical protein WBJ84_08300 [Bacteroidales bacterium]